MLITMKSWQNIYVHVWQSMLEKVLDLTIYPKHYFWVIYTHYDEEVLTKHIRRSLDIEFTFMFDIEFTMKSWQNIYDKIPSSYVVVKMSCCLIFSEKFINLVAHGNMVAPSVLQK